LIVDDDEGTRTTLSAGLGVQGHSVSSAATGHAALRVLNEHPPTAVLIDYHLADTDGVTLLRTIRQARVAPQAGTALFTADWDLLDRAVEVAELEAVIASKLCDLEQVNDLVTYLSLNGDASAGGWPARVLPC
jgi:CheY-like chemotaxis protein